MNNLIDKTRNEFFQINTILQYNRFNGMHPTIYMFNDVIDKCWTVNIKGQGTCGFDIFSDALEYCLFMDLTNSPSD